MKLIAGRKQKPVAVRLPAELQEAIEAAAARNGRSRNSEIVVRLAQSFGLPEERRADERRQDERRQDERRHGERRTGAVCLKGDCHEEKKP